MDFQTASRIDINLTKFEMVTLGDDRDADRLQSVLGCRVVKLLIKYLELPLKANYKEVRAYDMAVT